MKFKLLCLTLLYSCFALAQNDELVFLKGKIVSEIKELNEILVLNSRSESTTTTDFKGDFSLFAKVGDTLNFSGLQVVSKNIVLTKNDISKTLFAVTLQPKVFELNEVKVNEYPEINAVSLGILPKAPKKYTPAERKLSAAGVFKWYSPLLIPFGGMSVDGLLNSISGRTAMLKKELEIERKEMLKKKLENYFEEDYFTNTLKIPAENIDGFLYYAVDDEKLVKLASENNKSLLQFYLGEIATKYIKITVPKE
ncbi:MAG: hypothetical protein R2805_05725 [Flavobacterium sp.]|uniref:hypothetical protein n=1 Tax=Flavobacterium sp. TaxID=239 RepID=UPI002FD90F2D|nr:hypothetical protein [Bacteroidota bacterium]